MKCLECQFDNPDGFKFCGSCGHLLKTQAHQKSLVNESERKHVTIMFSDLSGYTAMTERLDPEETKEIMSLIFSKITSIINRYDGFIERFIGDAVMAVFGVPKAHEDDPIRAIRAAIEIKAALKEISPQFEKKIGSPLSIHTGINTGLVVTGEVNVQKGTHGLTGDAINLASRLQGIAKADEIIIGQDTFNHAQSFFEIEVISPAMVKGKKQPINIYKVKSAKKEFFKTHRVLGLQSVLTGRNKEMAILIEAAERLKNGRGSIVSISGDAGTGKSRLKEEFKDALNLNEFQWQEGHAYSYTQNMPYYPFINFITYAFKIDESDSPEGIREKLESGIAYLLGEDNRHTPYIGSLFSFSYPETEKVSPEYWKNKLVESIKVILSALMEKGPTVICFEDLHWADPSFIEIFKQLVLSSYKKALFICTCRSHFTFFSDLSEDHRKHYQIIRLKDLDNHDAQLMLQSLLGTQVFPVELLEIISQNAEGNPFYIEEIINSLIDSDLLTRDKGSWKLSRKITNADIPGTIHGVLSARIDRLEKHFKRLLQEASVIGRNFQYEIIERITDIDNDIDQTLSGLENLDLIRTKTLEPKQEYTFKHALIQEVVYNGLLMRDRKVIHERIAFVMEKLFHDRLPEFYETLALHFKNGQSVIKAVEYLLKSGHKSYSRYALEESHQYYKEAYEILSIKDGRSEEENNAIIDLLIKWGHVYNGRADLMGLEKILLENEEIAKSIGNKENLGMFYAWVGFVLRGREKIKDSYTYLMKALKLGEELSSKKIIGYSCAWLVWTCADLGLIDEGIRYGKRARELIEPLQLDGNLVRFTLSGLGIINSYRGDCNEIYRIGGQLIDYGLRYSDLRCLAMGYNCIGLSQYVAGNYAPAIESFNKSLQISADTIFTNAANLFLGMTYVANEEFKKAENIFYTIIQNSEIYGLEFMGTAAKVFYNVILISNGSLNKGVKIIEKAADTFLKIESMYRYASVNFIIGKFYEKLAVGGGRRSVSFYIKNIGFLIKNVPFASKKTEKYYNKAIEVAKKIGAKATLGQAQLSLGLYYKAKRRRSQAKESISMAIEIFEEIKANVFLKQAKDALATLDV